MVAANTMRRFSGDASLFNDRITVFVEVLMWDIFDFHSGDNCQIVVAGVRFYFRSL